MLEQVLFRSGQPLSRSSRPSLSGDGLMVRMRSTTFALLGAAAAFGLAIVAVMSQQGWPLLPSLPIPGPGSGRESIHGAAALPGAGPALVHRAQLPPTGTPADHGSSATETPTSRLAGSRQLGAPPSPAPGAGAGQPSGHGAPAPAPTPSPAEAPSAAPSPSASSPAAQPAPTPSPISSSAHGEGNGKAYGNDKSSTGEEGAGYEHSGYSGNGYEHSDAHGGSGHSESPGSYVRSESRGAYQPSGSQQAYHHSEPHRPPEPPQGPPARHPTAPVKTGASPPPVEVPGSTGHGDGHAYGRHDR